MKPYYEHLPNYHQNQAKVSIYLWQQLQQDGIK